LQGGSEEPVQPKLNAVTSPTTAATDRTTRALDTPPLYRAGLPNGQFAAAAGCG
jgi:hypothetical protein